MFKAFLTLSPFPLRQPVVVFCRFWMRSRQCRSNVSAVDTLSEAASRKGPLYHDDHIVFGDALVQAYRLESQIARYPRVIVPSEIGTRYLGEHNKDRIVYSDDGPMFVHTLRCLKDAPRDDFVNDYGMTPNKPIISNYGQMRSQI